MAQEKPFEEMPPIRPGERVLRLRREPGRKLRMTPNIPGFIRFLRAIVTQTPVLQAISLLIVLLLLFSMGTYFADRGASGTTIDSFGDAVYCAVAGFSTSGIADMPVTAAGKALIGTWMALGSLIFFGTIVAVATTYFMRPLQRPRKQIIATIQYNLEQLEDLSLEELEVLKVTTSGLIDTQIGKVKPE